MKANKIVAFTMAAMLLLAGTVAVGAATPAEQANSTAGNAPSDDVADGDDPDADDSAADDRPDEVGPSGGLPDAVPDHVHGIHERIGSFLNGSIDDLGSSLSDYLADGEQAENEQSDADNGDSDA